jgi:hypothetical protein
MERDGLSPGWQEWWLSGYTNHGRYLTVALYAPWLQPLDWDEIFPKDSHDEVIWFHLMIQAKSDSETSCFSINRRRKMLKNLEQLRTKLPPFSLCVQTSCKAIQPPIQWVSGVLYLGVKRGRGVTLTTHPIQCRGQELVGATLLSSQPPSWRVAELLYFTLFISQ